MVVTTMKRVALRFLFAIVAFLFGYSSCYFTQPRKQVIISYIDMSTGVIGLEFERYSHLDIIRIYGKPQISRETLENAQSKGFIDARESDYFDNIYADITCDNRDKVASISYNLQEISKKYQLNPMFVIRDKNKDCLIKDDMDIAALKKLLLKFGVNHKSILVKGNDLYVNCKYFSFSVIYDDKNKMDELDIIEN
jgi:hypothetical protein